MLLKTSLLHVALRNNAGRVEYTAIKLKFLNLFTPINKIISELNYLYCCS